MIAGQLYTMKALVGYKVRYYMHMKCKAKNFKELRFAATKMVVI